MYAVVYMYVPCSTVSDISPKNPPQSLRAQMLRNVTNVSIKTFLFYFIVSIVNGDIIYIVKKLEKPTERGLINLSRMVREWRKGQW